MFIISFPCPQNIPQLASTTTSTPNKKKKKQVSWAAQGEMSLHRTNIASIHRLPRPWHTSKDTKTKSQPCEIICIKDKNEKSTLNLSLSHLLKHMLLLHMILTKKYTAQEITGHILKRICKYS